MEAAKCPKCGQPLSILHWSGDKEITICNNGKCLAYRNPVSYVTYSPPSETGKRAASRLFEDKDGIFGPILTKAGSSRSQ